MKGLRSATAKPLLLVALMTSVLAALFLAVFERKTVTEEVEPEVLRQNPYYLLTSFLEERGVAVRHTRRWTRDLPLPDGAVFWFSHEPVPRALRDWLGAGGQLWGFEDPDGNGSWKPTPWLDADDNDAEGLEAEGLALPPPSTVAGDAFTFDDNPSRDDDASDDNASDECDYDYDYESWLTVRRELATKICGDPEAPCLFAAQYAYGHGTLTLVQRYALTNPRVWRGKTPARIEALLERAERPSEVLLITTVETPWFGQLLWKHAPEAVLMALCLLLLGLWRAGYYMGPKAPPPIVERRRWMEHVSAIGQLASRTSVAPLIERAREELRDELRARMASAHHVRGPELAAAVARELGVEAEIAQRALLEPAEGSSPDILAIVRAMLAIWRKL